MSRNIGATTKRTVLDSMLDPRLWGRFFTPIKTWRRWRVFLKCYEALSLTKAELRIFQYHTGRSRYQPPYPRIVFIGGRQSAKTTIGALIASHEAVKARPPQTGKIYSILVAQDQRSAVRALFSYVERPFETVPALRRAVVTKTRDTIELKNGAVIAAYPCRPQAVRGPRANVFVCDEFAHFISSDGYRRDKEMLRALKPTVATTGGREVILSSPEYTSGALYELHKNHFGNDKSPTLIWQAKAVEMNPTLSRSYLNSWADDPEAYRSEVEGLFRSGAGQLFDDAALEACRVGGRRELPPEKGRRYLAFADSSGGRRDSYAVAVGHCERDRLLVDALRAWSPPFNPQSVTNEVCDFVKSYGVKTVTGDRYGASWVEAAFRSNGVAYKPSEKTASDLYLEALATVNTGRAELPDIPELMRELRGLERRQGSTRDRVVHPPGGHDDRANVVAGLLYLLSKGGGVLMRAPTGVGSGSTWLNYGSRNVPHELDWVASDWDS